MEAKPFDEDVAGMAAWEKSTTGESLDGTPGIPVRWLSKYEVALRWVMNGSITIAERAGNQRSFTMRVEQLSMRTPTQYVVVGMTEYGRKVTVLFDLKYRSEQNGAGIVPIWPTDALSDTNAT